MIPLSKNILSKFPLRTLIWGTYTMCSFLEAFQFRTIKSYIGNIPFFSPNPLLGNCATHQLAKYSHPFTINIYNFRFTYRFSKNILLSQHVYIIHSVIVALCTWLDMVTFTTVLIRTRSILEPLEQLSSTGRCPKSPLNGYRVSKINYSSDDI